MSRNFAKWWVLMALAGTLAIGCRPVERGMIGLSRIKSPVTLAAPAVNQPFNEQELLAVGVDPRTLKPADIGPTNAAAPTGARYDSLADLRRTEPLVVVCLSGGGARAARMAAHTLACLEEKYNEIEPAEAAARPLGAHFDAWSTCSGGSIYASFAALRYRAGIRTNSFSTLADEDASRSGTKHLGGMAAFFYFWPLNLGYAPVMQLLTDWDTLDLFAHNLALFHERGVPFFPFLHDLTLGDLPARPRFYFNATCRETARPFILTQSVVHRDLSGDPLTRLAPDPLFQWIGEAPVSAGLGTLFQHASTLEDLGSPPGRFPLAYAAMASSAFPGVFEPLALRFYRAETNSPLWWMRRQVTLVDGGIYDNSGVITALQLFEHLRSRGGPAPAKLVLLAVDADNAPDRYAGAEPPDLVPWRFGLPIRGASEGLATLHKIYHHQQALVAAATRHHIRELEAQGLVDYFPVRLKDAGAIPAAPPSLLGIDRQFERVDLFGLVKRIPTDFVITDREDRELREVVRRLVLQGVDGKDPLAVRFVHALGGGEGHDGSRDDAKARRVD